MHADAAQAMRMSGRRRKAERVGHVFSSVAPSYDIMNDLMSGGLASALEGQACTPPHVMLFSVHH